MRSVPGTSSRRAWSSNYSSRVRPVIISTMNDLPGYEVEEVLGEVFGLTVRSRNLGSQIGASLKSLAGGELKGMTKMLVEGREHATERLVEEAEGKGANAILAFRFDTSELGTTWTEICAYGTAVRVRQV
ncbi:MAG: YbjQ family protein [Methanosarcina sp.]